MADQRRRPDAKWSRLHLVMSPPDAEEKTYEDKNSNEHSNGYVPTDLIEKGDLAKSQVEVGTLPEKDEEPEAKKDDKEPVVQIPFFSLNTTAKDKFLMFIGITTAFTTGAANPLIIIFLGDMLNAFVENGNPNGIYLECLDLSNPNVTLPSFNITSEMLDQFFAKCETFSINMLIVAAAHFILTSAFVSSMNTVAENQAFRIRHRFMRAILRQDIGWFDTHETGDFASRITTDLGRIQDGIGEKLGMTIFFYSTTILCLVAALYYGWKLTLVILSVMPVLVLATAIIAKIQAKISGSELDAYGDAGAVAEEVLSSIRTVVAFGGERKEISRYEKNLITARKSGIKRGFVTSIGSGLVWFCIYASYALAFWYGSILVLDSRCNNGDYMPSTLVVVFFCVLTAAMFVGQTAPYMEAFSIARGAASKIFAIINREPPIDSSSELGEKPLEIAGHIKFNKVCFSYPSRPNVQVLNGLSLEAVPGETVALVGSSGCGKSTVVQLLQRFYDPVEGQVEIDGKNIQSLNIGWLRDHIGVVGQEPVLFDTTIAENIQYGLENSTIDDVMKAAKEANAHNFIMNLPDKYKTLVGERGTQLSGGQKQRIAIARALIRNPKILLLDEATSALDTESESVVQSALDEASVGRTTLVVAHRLSTIRNADKIIAIKNGEVKEIGTHEELMKEQGLYYHLATAQQVDVAEESAEDSNEIQQQKVNMDRQFSISSTVSDVMSSVASLPIQKQEDDDEKNANPSQCRLLKMTTTEWPYIVTGCISAFLMGLSIPVYGVIFGDILQALSAERETAQKETTFYSILFLVMGVLSGIGGFLQIFMFTVAGERLTMRLRKMVFTTMITQEIAWFDDTKNSTGSLCSKLSSDAAHVQGATGTRLSTLCQSLSTLLAAIFMGLYYNYKLGLVVLSFIPLVLIATFFESRAASGQILGEKKAVEDATKIAIEAIENIRTVVSLNLETTFYKKYIKCITGPHKLSRKKAVLRGLAFGMAQGVPSLAYAAAMYYGSYLIKTGELTYGNLFKVLEGVILGTMIVGQAVAFAPDYHKAKIATARIFKLLDKKSEINVFSSYGLKPPTTNGSIQFLDIQFTYPMRPEIKVLRGLQLQVGQGQTVALVGSSGCGKSTCVQLLERFYNISKGELKLDGTNIMDLNLNWLRSQIGIVSQEPVLFGYSIAENIAYGDNSKHVPMDEVIEAAKQANIHSFIESLPAGYDTTVGDKGTQLSGGQKQRVAIARALVRNPKIILLDEATSALDTESEKVVQEALDKASEGRTCLVIAHRLSTIQNADTIVVINHGRIVESGTHHELLAKQGLYHKMHMLQSGALD